ncbi:hypothetical protein CUS10_13335 [Enterococcus faecium]|nr:hypothetical protein CUS10_13335 [Enterococcus faecium]
MLIFLAYVFLVIDSSIFLWHKFIMIFTLIVLYSLFLIFLCFLLFMILPEEFGSSYKKMYKQVKKELVRWFN